MVYAHKVNRVTLSGTMFNGAEEWSTGFWLGEENADASDPTDAAATDILALWTVFFENITSRVHQTYLTTQCKIAAINPDGNTDQSNVVYAYPGATVDGGWSQAVYPPQCSLVATLMSDRPRGLASKGRMYLPGIAAGLGAGGTIADSDRDAIAVNLRTFFNAVRADPDIPNTPILAAKGTGPFPNLTAQNDYIERIKVGNVIDTQRRRRNGLVETYKTEILT